MKSIEYHVLSKQFESQELAKTWALSCCRNLAKTNGVSLLQWHRNKGWFVIIPLNETNYTDMRFKSARGRSREIVCTMRDWLAESIKMGNTEITPLYVPDGKDKILNITYEALSQ